MEKVFSARKFFAGLIVMGLVSGISIQISSRLNNKELDYDLYSLDGSIVNLYENTIGLPSLFVYFDSDCEHCISGRDAILENYADYEGVRLIFISNNNVVDIKEFVKSISEIKNKPIIVQDKNKVFQAKHKITSVPYYILYDKDMSYLKSFNSIVRPNELRKYLE